MSRRFPLRMVRRLDAAKVRRRACPSPACERLEPRWMLASDPPPIPAADGPASVLIPAEVPAALRWSDPVSGTDLAAGVPITVPRGGILILEADAPGSLPPGLQLTLRDASGTVIVDLRKQAPGPGPLVRQFLPAGDYRITDEAPVATAAAFHLRFRPSSGFFQPLPVGDGDRLAPPTAVISVDSQGEPIDLDGDGVSDLVVAHLDDTKPLLEPGGITFFSGTGDGHFVRMASLAVGIEPDAVAVGRVAGPGSPRLIVAANHGSHDLSILRQRSDGSFDSLGNPVPVGRFPTGVALGDLDGDGLTDIVVANSAIDDGVGPIDGVDGSVSVLLQGDDGIFRLAFDLAAGRNPISVGIAAMDDDRLADIVVVNGVSDDVSILHGRTDGGFRPHFPPTPVGAGAAGLAIADLDHDGRSELVVANSESDSVSILSRRPLPAGDSEMVLLQNERVGIGPWNVLVADVTGDGRLDIVTADNGSNAISVLAGGSQRSFAPARTFATGSYPVSVAAVPGDGGRIDLLTADANDGTISVLRGLGEGDFLQRNRTSTGTTPSAAAGVDVNGDGRIDIITANSQSRDLSVLLGRGDGTFAPETRIPLGLDPIVVHAADVNGDGRADLLVHAGFSRPTPSGPVEISVIVMLPGLGDGTFGEAVPVMVPGVTTDPDVLASVTAVGDLNDDDLPDLAYATPTADGGIVFHALLNRGGRFVDTVTDGFTGPTPTAMVIVDVDRDGHVDLVMTNGGSLVATHAGAAPPLSDDGNVIIFYGDGQGRFPDHTFVTAGMHPGALTVADMDGDAWPDIVVANLNEPSVNEAGDVSVLRQSPGRRDFPELLPRTAVGISPVSLVVGDFSGDTRPDVIVANAFSKSLTGLKGVGGGHLNSVDESSLGTAVPSDLALADVDGDRRPDIVAVNALTNDIRLFITGGIPKLLNAPSQDVEVIRDASGVPTGVLSTDRQRVLRLRSLPGMTPPWTPHGDGEAFASTLLPTPAGPVRIASIDADKRSISIVDTGAAGPPERLFAAVSVDADPVLSRIVAADLDGNGWGDLVVTNPGAGTVDVLLADGGGRFDDRTWQSIAAGDDTSEVRLDDLDGDRITDLITVDQLSGSVSVRFGLATGRSPDGFRVAAAFGPPFRLRTSSLGYDHALNVSGHGTPVAPFNLTDIALGDVTGDGRVDIVAVNEQAHSFAILEGLRGGGFSAPQEHLVRIPLTPGPVVAWTSIEVQVATVGDFDGDGRADIALLDRQGERIVLYTTGDNPTFEQPGRLIPLEGNLPRSLLASDVDGPGGTPDGVLDLVIGNDYGDVLILQGQAGKAGRGNGRFESLVRTDKSVALLAADMDGDGKDDFIYGDRGLDRLTMDRTATDETFRADQSSGIIGPSAVATVDETVAGRPMRNLVVANGGGNEILLFSRNPAALPGSPDLFLAPQRFFVGSNPSALAVADLDADGLPDVVVANAGSNDLSVMLGSIDADGRWTMTAGPRLAAGGSNPAGVALGDFVRADGSRGRDGTPDIAVTTPGSSSANILAGRGGGFFNDRLPLPLVLPPDASPGPIVPLPGGVGIGNIGNATITIVDVTRSGANQELFASQSFFSGGAGPSSLAAVTSGGTTYLGVGNAGGTISLFVGKAGSLDFTLDRAAQLPGVTGLAFESTGRLFGMGPGRQSALDLFGVSVVPTPSGSEGSGLAAISAAVFYFPLRSSAVALVATIVSAGTLGGGEGGRVSAPTTIGRTGDRPAGDGASGEGDPGDDEGTPPEDGTAAEADEDPTLAALLELFLDVESTLRANNSRLLDTLLDEAAPRSNDEGDREPSPTAGADSPAPHPETVEARRRPAPTAGGDGQDRVERAPAPVETDALPLQAPPRDDPAPVVDIPTAAWRREGSLVIATTAGAWHRRARRSAAASRRLPRRR